MTEVNFGADLSAAEKSSISERVPISSKVKKTKTGSGFLSASIPLQDTYIGETTLGS
jgi:hypothetical protein